MHGHIGAVAHGHAHVGRGQGRGVVHAIAHHGDHMSALFEPHDGRRLVAGQHLGHHLTRIRVQPQPPCHGIRRAPVVARDHHAAHTARLQRRQRLFGARLGLVAKRHQGDCGQPLRAALDHGGHRSALLLQRIGRVCQRAQIHGQLLHPAQAADQVTAPGHLTLGASAGYSAHAIRLDNDQFALPGGLHHGARQRVFAAALHSGHCGKNFGLVP
ncbi:hypothetical protein SDC9_102574 [bioreactor metagenome]|uniref:Uncharacterized protein n=1 Tax=bioreactor metagenome TaxID=1076179 RepID=A0A645ART9_9ZZZZ